MAALPLVCFLFTPAGSGQIKLIVPLHSLKTLLATS
nr:MAG TPA: hypothetical protein [Caudoviricetes sp.]